MRSYRDQGIVLRTHKLGEADRIITLLTRSHGLVRAVAKGVRRTTSRFGARLEPFGVVDAQIHRGSSLDILTQVETIAPYGRAIGVDYELYMMASVMAETVEKLTREDEGSPQHFILLQGALHALAIRRHAPELILDSYLLRVLALAGWALSTYDCAQCGKAGPHEDFTIRAGGALCKQCRPATCPPADSLAVKLLGDLLAGNWEAAAASSTQTRSRASDMVKPYVQWQLEQRLRSLSVLERSA